MTDPYYQDDLSTLYLGDCIDLSEIWTTAESLLTDPPYGMSYKAGKNATGNGRNKAWTSRWTGVEIEGDRSIAVRDEALVAWGDEKPALVFGTWKRPAPAGVREMLVWDKKISIGMGALDIPWRPSWEAIYVLNRGFVGRRSHGVLCYGLATRAPERKMHPNAKPLALIKDLVAKLPGIVADPFAGSGTTLLAASELGRQSIGVELDERFAETAAKRLCVMERERR